MTSTRASLPVLLLALLSSLSVPVAVRARDLPPSVILEQKNDAQQVLLVRVADDGVPSDVLRMECGIDTYYTTSAVVLGVNRTVDPSATALGAQNSGRVMTYCDVLEFKTFERNWKEGCDDTKDPGRKLEGTCGYIFLTPGMDPRDPYSFAVSGDQGFQDVDGAICERELREHCPELVVEEEEGSDVAAADGGDADGDGASDGEGDAKSAVEGGDGGGAESGAVHSRLGGSALIGLLLVTAFRGI